MSRILRSTKTYGSRTVKTYRDNEWDEYVCRLFLDGDLYAAADYFTNDSQDADDTAEAMLRKGDELTPAQAD